MLGDDRRHQETRHRDRRQEDVEEQERFVRPEVGERAEAPSGAPDRHGHEHHHGQNRLSWAEAKRRPQEDRKRQERQRIAWRREIREQKLADEENGEEECSGVPPAVAQRAERIGRGPQDEGRGEQQGARPVAQPPGQPDGPVVRPRCVAGQTERRGSDGRAHHRADQTSQDGEPKDVAGTLEGGRAVGEAPDEVASDEAFQGVADGDRQGRGERPVDGKVHGKGPDEDAGPHPIPEQQERGQRQPGGRPERCRTGVDRGERQSEPPHEDVRRRERRDDPDRSPRGQRGAKHATSQSSPGGGVLDSPCGTISRPMRRSRPTGAPADAARRATRPQSMLAGMAGGRRERRGRAGWPGEGVDSASFGAYV